jgi:hypothetical protein
MSSLKKAKRAASVLALLALPALSVFGCSSIIGLGDYTVAEAGGGKPSSIGSAGSAGSADSAGSAGQTSSNGGDAGAGGEGNGGSTPSGTLGCDGKTSFKPNEDIVRSCLLRTGCDPSFNPIRNISTCVTFNTQAALPGESCNLTSKTCADYEACEHIGVAGDDLCGGTKTTRCENGKAINCGNYKGNDRFADCAIVGQGCDTYTYTNDLVYADCTVRLDDTDTCVDKPDDDATEYCNQASGDDPSRYYCWGGKAFGNTCTAQAKCEDDLEGTDADGNVTGGGDASCFFNLTKCTQPVTPTCNGKIATECSGGSLFKYDCGSVGLDCNITSSSEYCLAPGCKATDVDTNCTESCSDDGTQLTFCYGGTPYTVTCADYGFTQCLSDTDDNGAPFAACRF